MQAFILCLRLVANINRPIFMLDGLNTRHLTRLDELSVSKHKKRPMFKKMCLLVMYNYTNVSNVFVGIF